VVPSQIPSDSVRITGTSNQLNISWAPSVEVEYGQVYYSLVMESLGPDTQTIRIVSAHLISCFTLSERVFAIGRADHEIPGARISPVAGLNMHLDVQNFSE